MDGANKYDMKKGKLISKTVNEKEADTIETTMGSIDKEKEISDSRKMKLALSFCVFYSASAFQSVDWNDGKNEDMGNPCGSFVQFDEPEDFGEFRKGSKLMLE